MKGFKRLLLLCFSVLCILLPASVSADDPKIEVKENEEYIGRVLLEDKKYPLSHYKVETQTGDSILSSGDKALAGLNDGLWSINKQIAKFTIFAVETLMTFDIFSQISSQVSVISERIFDSFSDIFLGLFLTFAVGVAAYRYYVNQQVAAAVKAFIGVVLVLTASLWFFSDVEKNVTWINEVSADIEGAASSTNVLLTSDEFNSNEPADKQEGTAVLRNQLFDLMIKKPYLLLNYGTTKESKIVKEDPERINNLLAIKPYQEEAKEKRKEIVKEEVETNENFHMSADYSAERFGQVLLTLISTIAVSIPVLAMAAFKFLLQLGFLAMVIFIGIPLIISLIPTYAETAAVHFKGIIYLILYKAALVLLIAIATGIATLIYESVKVTDGLEGFMLIVFIQVLVMWGIFKYRTQIMQVASAGMIQGNNAAERIQQSIMYSVSNTANKGLELTKRVTSESMRLGGKARETLGRTESADYQQSPARTESTNNQQSPARNLSVINGGGQGSNPSAANRQESLNQGQKGSNQASGTNEGKEKGSVVPISDWREKAGKQQQDGEKQQGNKNEAAQSLHRQAESQSIDSMASLVNSGPPAENENGSIHRQVENQQYDSISSQDNQAARVPQAEKENVSAHRQVENQQYDSSQDNQTARVQQAEKDNVSAHRQVESMQNDSFSSLANSIPPESEVSGFYMNSSTPNYENVSRFRQPERKREQGRGKGPEMGRRSKEAYPEAKGLGQRETAVTREARGPNFRNEAKRIKSE
ncbi:hypothetical protein J7J00_24735 [Bacillus sp. ISL-4]|uniref:CD3337/EF1877 family mobilome membrane protein n=1 Tax=Bacillus sp. ISL-4 TaxID=2819125 RepID=UPI001BE8E33E|nr:hypothetical protein [Bacillus sp. ISL-4]MBT2668640.1 hypothetical protein [Bacillus sp. ISL-4]MBT2673386.1 hypothetical protein [Streptomyces sp. ISL-14]